MGSNPIGEGDFTFDFNDRWFSGDHHRGNTDGWAHHGIVVTSGGEIVTFDEKLPRVQVLSNTGELVRTFDVDLTEGAWHAAGARGRRGTSLDFRQRIEDAVL
ncbi:hypothetical protein SIM91_18590 [Rhodococcus opacus]|uniref:hypothetical protein n=1 Tax=Rhodococcus opacus TaxID=37919 RepID=UPI0002D6C20B|nr:hypothetical protein [Rhodococcus opacus]MDX5965272.1 hypothetical protein [Rhodococcus opacus]NKY76946.1 hypothetical protein [Rhodococcus opacus]